MSSDSGTEMASPQLARAFAVVGMGGGPRINRGYQPSRTPSSRYQVMFMIFSKSLFLDSYQLQWLCFLNQGYLL